MGNKTAYVSDLGDHNYGGVTRGGACFQLYARHFRGGKPLLGYTVSAGDSSQRRLVAVWDPARRAYYVYFSNVNGTGATATLDLSALDVQPGAPVSVARVDANNTGQITDYLSVDGTKKVTFNAPNNAALLVWIPQNTSAGTVLLKRPTNDTYLVVGETGTNHSAEPTMKVSLHHATASERRIGFLQFDLSSLAAGNRYLLKLPGHNIGASPTAREILHVYGAGSGTWSETNLTWAAAPGAGRYYTSTDSMAPATGLGSMVDIEDNYKGVTSGTGTGLGLCGKFLGPVSFYSSSWATNYVDVTDYVNSLIASNQTHATFVIARIVRYDVNQFSNSTYYTQGVYDCDGRIVELGTKENSNTALQSGLLVWASAPLYWSGAGTWYADASHANWGSSSGGPYTMTAWGDGYGHAAVFEGAAGVVTLNGTTYADSLTFNTSGYTVTATTNALFLGGGPNKTVTVTNGAGATIGAVVAGTANLAKAGAGTLSLTGGGFWTGATTVGAGTLQLAKPSGSGAASWSTPTITIANGGTLQLGSSDNFGNATATTSPAVTINAGGTVSNNGGAGNWFNTLWNLTLSGGTLYAQGGNASWGAYALGGTVTVNTAASTISGDGTANAWIDLNSAGTTFNVAEVTGNASADLTISAPIKGGSSGWNAGSLIKTGLGTLALSAANTYSGGTTVNGGTFLVNGSTASGSAVTVGASGTLGGNGTINGPVSVTAGGILSPGNNGFGTLTLANNSATALTLDRATVQCDLANVAGASDRVAISGGAGALVLNGANTITLYTPLGTAPAGTYTLMTYAAQTGSGTLALDQVYTNATLTVGTTSVTLTVTGSGTVGTLINRVWKGGLNANAWDTTTTNWLANGNAATYFDPSPVTFDDTGFASPGINIVSAVSPASVTVNSSIKAYSIGGAAIGGTGGLTKSGTATLTLSGSNTYSDGTTIAVGTLILSGGDNRLPANKLNFSGTSTLNISGGSQTLTNLTVADSVIGAVTGAGGSLRINGGDFRIGGTVGYAGQTLDMSSLGTFVYNGPNYTFDVGGEQAASGSSWEWGVLWLAATNTITAQTFGIQTVSDNRSATGNWNKGTNYLGRVNIINADTIRVGTIASGRSTPTGWLGFSTTTTGILTIGGTVGGTNRADITVGEINSSSQYPGATGIIDLTNNVTGTSTLTALVDQLLLGQHQGYNARAASGTFIMGGGILDANTIMIGQATSSATGAGSAEGCFSLNGGTVLVKTLTLGDQQTGSGNTVVGQMTMNGGNLAAQTLQSGAGTATQIFNWKSGTISNYDADTDLAIDIPTLTLDAGGTHTFNISAGRTATVSAVLTETNGAATLTKTGDGTVTLTGGNIYTGGTAVGNGTLLVNGSLDVGAVTLAANARLGGTGAINGAVTVNSGGTLAPGGSIGTLTINNNLTLAGNLLIEVNKSASTSNDLVVVSGTLTNAGAGTVTVTNIGAIALVAGDRFVLFNKALFNGQALTITSGGGVVWTNKLALDGSIAVVSAAAPAVPATNLAIVAAGPASFSVSGRGGASQAYGLYASTNVVVPMTNWWLIGTTNSDGSGSIQFLDTHATNPQRFYRFGQ
ncbi:MAG: autotransporter-associated beta strand repeat-containing protein [Verrucomicrobiae bacterium]